MSTVPRTSCSRRIPRCTSSRRRATVSGAGARAWVPSRSSSRTKEYAARKLRGEDDVDPMDYATEEHLVFSPLPCWEHLPETEWRRNVANLIDQIEEEGARDRKRKRKMSLGVNKIMRVRPHKRPRKVERTPKPRFHAIGEEARKRMREAYTAIVVAYLIASERLRAGDRNVEFPEGTFPPGLPFVSFSVRCRGQPA